MQYHHVNAHSLRGAENVSMCVCVILCMCMCVYVCVRVYMHSFAKRVLILCLFAVAIWTNWIRGRVQYYKAQPTHQKAVHTLR